MLDFDGTLSAIVARPEHARPVDGAREALIELTSNADTTTGRAGSATSSPARTSA